MVGVGGCAHAMSTIPFRDITSYIVNVQVAIHRETNLSSIMNHFGSLKVHTISTMEYV